MPDNRLTAVGDSLAELLQQAEERYAADLSAEEELNKLKTSNLVTLGRLSKAQQEEFYASYRAHLLQQVADERKKHEQKLADLQEEFNTLKGLNAKDFHAQTGMTKKAFKDKLKQEQDLVAKKKDAEIAAAKEVDKQVKKLQSKTKDELIKEYKKDLKELSEDIFGKGKSFSERTEALKKMGTVKGEDGKEHFNAGALLANLSNALGDLVRQLDSTIDSIGKYKGAIDTRLYGSKNQKN